MTDDNSSNLVDIPEDLADFKTAFLGTEKPAEVEDTEDDTLATDEATDAPAPTEDEEEIPEDSEDEDSDESEAEDEESDDEEEEEAKPEEKEKNRKASAQKRINELTKARREAERQNAELLRRLEALETVARNPKDSAQEIIQEQLPQGAPTPDAVNDKGEPKYPLGEFDAMFIRDLMNFTVEQKEAEYEVKRERAAAAQQLAQAQAQLKGNWSNKLDAYEENVPEIRDHIEDLVESFQQVEPAYGEYLAMTIMQCENGPAIMEYLSQNIGEAQNIVASGPAAATLAIGRLEAKLDKSSARSAEEKRNKRASNAPTPPANQTRGSKGQSTVREDTEDLAAFKRVFLSK